MAYKNFKDIFLFAAFDADSFLFLMSSAQKLELRAHRGETTTM